MLDMTSSSIAEVVAPVQAKPS